jgi:hypothetical protein
MPDLIVVPVPMLGRPAAPLIGALADRGDRPLPSVAFYWSKIEETELGGPTPFGSCWYVARGADWNQTYERLMGCIGQPAALHLAGEQIGAHLFEKYVA